MFVKYIEKNNKTENFSDRTEVWPELIYIFDCYYFSINFFK